MTQKELTIAAMKRVEKWPEPNAFEASLKQYELTRLRKKLEELEREGK